MTPTFRSAVEAALNELDNRPDLDHWRVYSADRLSESILAHLTAWALASVEREDAAIRRSNARWGIPVNRHTLTETPEDWA